jgi:hypothetical protein
VSKQDEGSQPIDTVAQSKQKAVQLCADMIVMMNIALRDAGDQELSERAVHDLLVITIGKYAAKAWRQDIENAKANSTESIRRLLDDLKEGEAIQ